MLDFLARHYKESRRRRHFRAVLTIYFAVLTYRRLSAEDRDRVNEWIREFIDGPFNTDLTFLDYEMFFETGSKAAFWAVAMMSLDIPPALEGAHWPKPGLKRWWDRLWAVDRLLLAYQPESDVTGQVEEYLIGKGVDASALKLRTRLGSDRRKTPR